jgi:hypothetical protein
MTGLEQLIAELAKRSRIAKDEAVLLRRCLPPDGTPHSLHARVAEHLGRAEGFRLAAGLARELRDRK